VSRGLFVTGTDTNVGKTALAAALMHRYRGHVPLRYWKPIQTGIESDDDSATVARLGGCSLNEIVNAGLRLPKPVSPHLAARWSGVRISIDALAAMYRQQSADDVWIVEGAGGVLVPINERETMADLMAALALPAVVAARTALGTINHTLLTLEALRHRSIPVAGVVLVGPPNAEAREAIETYGNVAVVGEMPHLDSLTADVLESWSSSLDPSSILLEPRR